MNRDPSRGFFPVDHEVRCRDATMLDEGDFKVEEVDGVASYFESKVDTRIVFVEVNEERVSFVKRTVPNAEYVVHVAPPRPDEVGACVCGECFEGYIPLATSMEGGPPMASPSGN